MPSLWMKGLGEMTGNYKERRSKTISLKEFIDKYYETENTEMLDKGRKIIDKQIKAIVAEVVEIRGKKSIFQRKLSGRKRLRGSELRENKIEIEYLEKRKNTLSKIELSLLNNISELKSIRREISEKSQDLKDGKKDLHPKIGGIEGYTGWRTQYMSDYDLDRDDG